MGQAARQSGVRGSSVEVRLDIGVGPSFVVRPLSPRVPPSILPAVKKLSCSGARARHHEWLGLRVDDCSCHTCHSLDGPWELHVCLLLGLGKSGRRNSVPRARRPRRCDCSDSEYWRRLPRDGRSHVDSSLICSRLGNRDAHTLSDLPRCTVASASNSNRDRHLRATVRLCGRVCAVSISYSCLRHAYVRQERDRSHCLQGCLACIGTERARTS